MALASGTKLGPYEILNPLGAGGMGEVYRAKDTRLDRTVAIKVLPSHLSSDPELKQRMEREAKAISALQHANICTLYDIGTQDGTQFLVMEYLEGQTLAERLVKGRAAGRASFEDWNRNRAGSGESSSTGHHSSRSEAGEHYADQSGRKADGLWSGQAQDFHRGGGRRSFHAFHSDGESCFAHCGGVAAHAEGFDRWNLSIHGARTSAGRGGRRPQRPVQFRMRSL